MSFFSRGLAPMKLNALPDNLIGLYLGRLLQI